MYYYAIVHHDPGSAFGVSFPDFPDCFAAADEEEDVLKNAISALDDYLSDVENHPVPNALDVVRNQLAEDLAEGAYLISVPYIPRPTKSARYNASMDRGLLAALDAAADQLSLTRSAFIAQAVQNEIKGSIAV